jgi:hypothetical protein
MGNLLYAPKCPDGRFSEVRSLGETVDQVACHNECAGKRSLKRGGGHTLPHSTQTVPVK